MDEKGLNKFYEAVHEAYFKDDHGALKKVLKKIMGDIKTIMVIANNPKIVFVGGSVLCHFNLSQPELSEAKLIDPDHPILLSNENFSQSVPNQVMNKGHFESAQESKWVTSERDWDEYKKKWTEGFQFGLKSLYEFFDAYEQRI